MKQVTILCSEEIRAEVIRALHQSGVDAYAEVGGVTGRRPKDPRFIDSRDLAWPAAMFVLATDDQRATRLVEALRAFAGSCSVQPCLRVLVTATEVVL